MELKSLQKVWLALVVVQLIFALTVIGETQGADIVFAIKSLIGIKFAKGTADSVIALWGIIILSISLAIIFAITMSHARLIEGKWWSKLPLRILDFHPDIQTGRWFARGGILIAFIVPLWTLGHSWRILHKEGVICVQQAATGNWLELGRGWAVLWQLPKDWTWQRLLQDGYRLAGEAGCTEDKTTFFPLIEPVFLALLTFWAFFNLIRAIKALIHGSF